MSITLRYAGPPSPGWADDGETWVDDLGTGVGYPVDRRVAAGEAFTLDGDGWSVVDQDPGDPAAWAPDAILLDTPNGQRVALPRTLWAADGERQTVATIPDVLARVDGNAQLARLELDAEQARGDAARPTLLTKLQDVIDAGAPADTTPEG